MIDRTPTPTPSAFPVAITTGRCDACRRPVQRVQAGGQATSAEPWPPVQVRWSPGLGSLFLWFRPHRCRERTGRA